MLNLCLHCGAHHVERQAVYEAATPEHTATWYPISHQRLLEQVESSLMGAGLRVVSEAHAIWGNGLRYFGLLEVVGEVCHTDYGLVIGVRNSHDKSFPATLGIGSAVFVCDNLSFSAEVTIARRHTRFIERDLPQLVQRAVGQLTDARNQQDRRISAYKSTLLEDRAVHDLIVRALDAQAIPATQVPAVLTEWRAPRHPEFRTDGKTAWRLLNAFTEVWKGRNLTALPRRSQALHGLLDSVCAVAA